MVRGVVILVVSCWSVLLSLPGSAPAREPQRRAQVQAAQGDAVASLLDQIRGETLMPDLSVGQFLERTGGEGRLRQSVEQNADLIGATRWPNPGTCQVHLEVNGDEVIRTLVAIANDAPDKSPVPADVLGKRMEPAWKRRTFSATGTSATPEAVEKIRPGPEYPLWLTVPEEDRRQAVRAAHRNAATRAIDELSDIPFAAGKTLSDALEVPAVRAALQKWVAGRPVTNIEFQDNGEVRLTVSAPGEDLWSVLCDALGRQDRIPTPKDEAEWQRLHDEVVSRLRSPVGGRGAVTPDRRPEPRTAVRVVDLPQQPPAWADEQLSASGTAAGRRGLSLRRVAEDEALKDLHTQLKGLPLGDGRTVGEAARDPRVAAALERCLQRARSHKVDWGANGESVTVRVSLDLQHVWQELSRH